MSNALKQAAATLLMQADEAVDRRDNGLWDRGDFIQLIDQFRQLTRNFVKEQQQLECDRGELMHRLSRSQSTTLNSTSPKRAAAESPDHPTGGRQRRQRKLPTVAGAIATAPPTLN